MQVAYGAGYQAPAREATGLVGYNLPNRHQRRALAARAGVSTVRLGAKRKRRLMARHGASPAGERADMFRALERAGREGGPPDYAWLDGVPL